MILERGVEIRLSQVPRVACLCKETEVGELKPFHHRGLFPEECLVQLCPERGMDKHYTQEEDIGSQKY